MPITPKEMLSHLKKNGFVVTGQNGSHIKMFNPETVDTPTVKTVGFLLPVTK